MKEFRAGMGLEQILDTIESEPKECDCPRCMKECAQKMCFGTPDDIVRLIHAGFKDLLHPVGMVIVYRGRPHPVEMIQLAIDKGGCALLQNGKCLIHNTGLKPLEGRLYHHYHDHSNGDIKAMTILGIALEWMKEENRDKVRYCFGKIFE